MGKYKREDLYLVKVWYRDDQGGMRPATYHNILCDRPGSWNRSKAYFKSILPTAQYCNIYGGISGEYKRREYF